MTKHKQETVCIARKFGNAALPALASLLLLLSGCSSVNLWPFGGEGNSDQALVPADATAFRCAGGALFYMRYLDDGKAAWVIFADREFRLDKVASGSGTRYSNGIETLEVGDKVTTLTGGPGVSFTACKTVTKGQ